MQAFTHYQPTAFEQNPHTLTRCAALTCEEVVPFGKSVVWGWEYNGEKNFRAFCSYRCSLEALPEQHFNQA